MQSRLETITIEPKIPAQASVIWLHGLGADGNDFVPIIDQLKIPATAGIRFIFPHAQPRPVTLNNGYMMRAWYDIQGLDRTAQIDSIGIEQSIAMVNDLIDTEQQRGINANKIILAGFSQGGAIALQTGLNYPQRLAGILGLSTYLPLPDAIVGRDKHLPIMLTHGLYDSVLKYEWGEMSRNHLQRLGFAPSWHSYPMDHEVCLNEINDISKWLQACLHY